VPREEVLTPQDPEKASAYGRIVRNSAAPDVAESIRRIEFETDVRAVLPLVQARAVLVSGTKDDLDEAEHIASLMPNATLHVLEGRSGVAVRPFLDALRKLAGLQPEAADLDTVLASVLFTDIVDSTAKQAALGDRAWKDLVLAHHATVRSALERWHGTENDTAGDGFFATFDGPARAVRCALDVSERIRDLGLQVRAGVHTGECQIVDGKHAGIAVTIAARVSARAGPSEVLVTQTVKDLVAGSGLGFREAGEHELKGIPDRWRVYRAMG
jgi:class 3 adenylate cyclase